MATIFRDQFRQSLYVAAAGLRINFDQRPDQGVVEPERELLRHDAPDAFARRLVRRMEADQRDAARDDGLVDVVDTIGGEEQQAVEIFQYTRRKTPTTAFIVISSSRRLM